MQIMPGQRRIRRLHRQFRQWRGSSREEWFHREWLGR